jgi:hypothetical protein
MADPLRYLSLELTDEGIAESSRPGVHDVFLPGAGLREITVCRGFVAERMLAQLILGAACLAGCVALGAGLVRWLAYGGHGSGRLVACAIPLALFAFSILWSALRRGYYLRVRTARETRKLAVKGDVDVTALGAFLRAVESAHAVPIKTAPEA